MPEMLFVQDVTTPSALLNGLDQRATELSPCPRKTVYW
jgi:hypothetical protein